MEYFLLYYIIGLLYVGHEMFKDFDVLRISHFIGLFLIFWIAWPIFVSGEIWGQIEKWDGIVWRRDR